MVLWKIEYRGGCVPSEVVVGRELAVVMRAADFIRDSHEGDVLVINAIKDVDPTPKPSTSRLPDSETESQDTDKGKEIKHRKEKLKAVCICGAKMVAVNDTWVCETLMDPPRTQ
jgi:hypothetical protein